ncbi:hypothetical protein [Alkalibacterium kapii]|uniref:DUF4822 domain-containing protein n=1 Tax=Alkalibacterium kapii TaxID=426704 RepID=A0A511AWC9_9LACT|nr:hypothetical protein [Alkalibacterium kapii]GEK91623.1 hypothetical protein AKA01nite_12450 [Alkalibacterium kapii]
MNTKRILGLLAVSTLALTACGNDDTADVEETAEDVAQETEDAVEETGDSAMDVINDIDSDLDYTSSVGLEIIGGTWSQDGYIFTPTDGEATVNGKASPEDGVENVYAFVIEDGVVFEKPELTENEFTFTVSETDTEQKFQIGVSDEDLWEVGDEADPEELVRYEDIIIESSQAE